MSAHTSLEPGLHRSLERAAGSGDLRLVYGLGVPFLAATAVIVAALVSGTMWLVALAVLAVIAMAVVIMVEFGQMLDEDDDR